MIMDVVDEGSDPFTEGAPAGRAPLLSFLSIHH